MSTIFHLKPFINFYLLWTLLFFKPVKTWIRLRQRRENAELKKLKAKMRLLAFSSPWSYLNESSWSYLSESPIIT